MATMIPNDVDQFTTDGERQFYKFLERVARPDSRYLSWYLPDIKGREPDFILYSEDVGLVIFEVKDWILDQILEAGPHYFNLQIGSHEEQRQNPLKQAKDYFTSLMSKIKQDGALISSDPIHHGKPKIPVSYGVVFPNIVKFDYRQKKLDQVIETDRVFFFDDLHPMSDICSDTSGLCFQEALKRMFSPFSFKITGKELERLKALIFPIVQIREPQRGDADKLTAEKRLKVLDQNQESVARKIEGGHRILMGPSGCGKTLILVHRAALLKQYNPHINNILFLCYNITLVNYIKRLLSNLHVSLGDGGVEVLHVFDLCAKILGEKVEFEKLDQEYYDMTVKFALEKAQKEGPQYDAVMIDEGQDFTDDMFKLAIALLNKKTDNLLIVLDDNQNIYRKGQAWKNLGIKAQGRVHRLNYVYRNTVEIAALAARFMSNGQSEAKPGSPQSELFPDTFDYHGPRPELKHCTDIEEIVRYIGDRVKELADAGLPLSEMAVLYTAKEPYLQMQAPLPQMLTRAFEKKGILSNWVAEDYSAKKAYDITTNRVTISTVQSVKGMDYACVFLIGLDSPKVDEWEPDVAKNLTYVAMTRARERLHMPYVTRSKLIDSIAAAQEAST